eukprot:evm.model.scf_216.1 EVM.evm.TU.scf_216.1   scf_216:3629-14013(+)
MLREGLLRSTGHGLGTRAQRAVATWATVDPSAISGNNPTVVQNLVAGEWTKAANTRTIPDPLNGEEFIHVADTAVDEIQPFVAALNGVPKSGIHNPFKKPERYVLYGDVTARASTELRGSRVQDFFAKLIQRVAPKSYAQAMGEVTICQKFLENFGGDQVRFLARGFSVPGDHGGQQSHGFRWPYGGVALITPFNFPMEIPVLQLMGALFMGNRPLLHVDHRVSIVMEQFIRMLHHCGMPTDDADFFNGKGEVMNELLLKAKPRSTLFTGSGRVAEKLAVDMKGKIYLEDAGFDWKILGPDVQALNYVAWVCDQDAYAYSGQKCSATSMLMMHENWAKAGLMDALKARASCRKLDDLTVGPILSWTTERMMMHIDKLLRIPGARVEFGGKPLTGHSIPDCYGALQPTAVFVPIEQILMDKHWETVTTEVFGPVQVITQYQDSQLNDVLAVCEKLDAHLTAAVVSNDMHFLHTVLGQTVNGTTYAGLRARTTGAPQNHWFGPSGDPRAAGIGTPEAIRHTWSCHREIIQDFGTSQLLRDHSPNDFTTT